MYKHYRNLYLASLVLLVLITAGALMFRYVEHFTWVEAFYMTVITISTVGFEEVRPLSDTGMIFTSILILLSFGLFAYLITSVTRIFIDGEYKSLIRQRNILRTMQNLENHVIVCGFGRNGRQAVIDLLEHGEWVVLIEKSTEVMNQDINRPFANEKKLIHLLGDATHDETLLKANLLKCKALVISIPNDAENLLIILTARYLSPTLKIISRASDDNSYPKLIRAGANHVIMPDKVGGTRMARLVSQPDIIEFVEMIMIREGVDVNIEEISCDTIDPYYSNRSVGNLDIRKKTGANLIGIKHPDGKYSFNPDAETRVQEGMKLFVIGTIQQVELLKKLLHNPKLQ